MNQTAASSGAPSAHVNVDQPGPWVPASMSIDQPLGAWRPRQYWPARGRPARQCPPARECLASETMETAGPCRLWCAPGVHKNVDDLFYGERPTAARHPTWEKLTSYYSPPLTLFEDSPSSAVRRTWVMNCWRWRSSALSTADPILSSSSASDKYSLAIVCSG